VEKIKFLTLPGLELRCLHRSAHSQPLYRLRYPGSRLKERLCDYTASYDLGIGSLRYLTAYRRAGATLIY
jgi:hypothetical protein